MLCRGCMVPKLPGRDMRGHRMRINDTLRETKAPVVGQGWLGGMRNDSLLHFTPHNQTLGLFAGETSQGRCLFCL